MKGKVSNRGGVVEGMGSVTEIVGSKVVVWKEFMFISGKISMLNSVGVRVVISSSDVVETLVKLAGIGSRLEEDASSTFVKVGSVDVKVGVVSCVMSCVFVVIVSSTDVWGVIVEVRKDWIRAGRGCQLNVCGICGCEGGCCVVFYEWSVGSEGVGTQQVGNCRRSADGLRGKFRFFQAVSSVVAAIVKQVQHGRRSGSLSQAKFSP